MRFITFIICFAWTILNGHTEIITFNNLVSDGNFINFTGNTHVEGNFSVSADVGTIFVIDNDFTGGGDDLSGFDDDVIDLALSAGAQITVTNNDGNAFNASTFKFLARRLDISATFTGNISGGGQVQQTFNATVNTLENATLVGFNNLDSLVVTLDQSRTAGFSIDDLEVNAVPEPSTYIIIGLLCLTAAFAKVKRKKTT